MNKKNVLCFLIIIIFLIQFPGCVNFDKWENKSVSTPTINYGPLIYDTLETPSSLKGYKKFSDDSIDIEFFIPYDWVTEIRDLSDIKNNKDFLNLFYFEGEYPDGFFLGFFPENMSYYKLFALLAIKSDGEKVSESDIQQWTETSITKVKNLDTFSKFVDSKIYDIDNFPLAAIMYNGKELEYGLEMFNIVGRYQTNHFFYLITMVVEENFQNDLIDNFLVFCSTIERQ